MAQNVTGQNLDYDSFKAQFDTNPQLKSIVDRFDDNGITIKTKNKAEPESIPGQKKTSSIEASAKRAAAKTLKQPG